MPTLEEYIQSLPVATPGATDDFMFITPGGVPKIADGSALIGGGGIGLTTIYYDSVTGWPARATVSLSTPVLGINGYNTEKPTDFVDGFDILLILGL